MRSMLIALMALACPFAYANSIEESVKVCQVIDDSLQRLACYDATFNNKVETKSESGEWKVTTTSPIDGSTSVFLSINSNDPILDRDGRSQHPSMVIRCAENSTDLYITWNAFIGSNEAQLLTRIDSEKAVKKYWSISTDNKTTLHPSGTINFINSLLGKEALLVQVTPYGASPINTVFNISGLDEAIKPLREACKW